MAYTFKNTEINNEKASDFETKSTLYLIGKRIDSKEIEYVTFDCFNDVSGVNKKHSKIWDIQSKNENSLSPKKIGTYLYTLFDNYISALDFKEFIFFCPILRPIYKIDSVINVYQINNIHQATKKRIKTGLTKEVERVKGKAAVDINKIEEFLDIVNFVEDNETENEYIKSITKFRKTQIKSDDFYKSVFIELKNIQSSKKNSYIENSTIKEIREVLRFNRHLYVKDIELLIISRIIGFDLFEKFAVIPIRFSVFIDTLSIEDKKDIIQECDANLSRAFFNKNSNKIFWKTCEDIIVYVEKSRDYDVDSVFQEIFPKYSPKISYLNEITVKYLIAIIIGGIE